MRAELLVQVMNRKFHLLIAAQTFSFWPGKHFSADSKPSHCNVSSRKFQQQEPGKAPVCGEQHHISILDQPTTISLDCAQSALVEG